jgi:hypothetical protein
MNRPSVKSTVFIALIILGACIAGCSDSSSGEPVPIQQPVVTTPSGPVYGAGDIVKNPKSSSGAALLIIAYNAAGDTYERAYIYPNPDGSWGYRLDAKTDSTDRAVIERVYTEKAGTVTVSSVKIQSAPTVTVSSIATATTGTTATVTATSTKAFAPKITMVDPDKGKTGTTVAITDITGDNFQSGANVSLTKKGEKTIQATDVVVTTNLISCNVAIPSDAGLGYWNLVVTNPDKQYDEYLNAFLVQEGTATTATTAPGTTATATVTFVSSSPSVLTTGGTEAYASVVFVGSNLNKPAKLQLVKGSTTITSASYYASSSGSAQATFNIPAGSIGTYTVNALDSSNNIIGTMTDGFKIQ